MGCGGSMHKSPTAKTGSKERDFPTPAKFDNQDQQEDNSEGSGEAFYQPTMGFCQAERGNSKGNESNGHLTWDSGGKEPRPRAKSELRLMEISQTRRSVLLHSTSSRGHLTGSDNSTLRTPGSGRRRSMLLPAGRRTSVVRSFESSLRDLLEGTDGVSEIMEQMEGMDEEGKLRLVFDQFQMKHANEQDTEVRTSDLRDGLLRMKMDKSQREVDVMFSLCDKDHSGRLNFEEFKSFFRNLITDQKACDDEPSTDNETTLRNLNLERIQGAVISREREYTYGTRPLRGFELHNLDSTSSGVRSLCCSRNRPLFAVADFESAVISIYYLREDHTSSLVRMIHGQSDGSIAMSTDKKSIAVSGREATLVINDMTVGCVMQELEHVGAVTCCVFPLGGKTVLTACQDNLIRYFQVSKGKLLRKSEKLPNSKTGVIVSLACHKVEIGSTIAVSRTHEHYVRIIGMTATSFNQLHTLRGHRTTVWGCQYSTDGQHLLSHCDKLIKVWNPVSKECLVSIDVKDVADGRCDPETSVWTTACYASEAYSHVVVGVSTEAIHFVNICDKSVLLNLPTRYPVSSISPTFRTNEVLCGDEQGNVFSLAFW